MDTKKTTIKLFPISISPTLLTIAIIAIRAFQVNAEPMSQWSIVSWIWMTMPVWLLSSIGFGMFIGWFIVWIWAESHK